MDLYLAVYPAVILAQLQMNMKKKMALGVALGIGSIACVVAAYKCTRIPSLASDDFSCEFRISFWPVVLTLTFLRRQHRKPRDLDLVGCLIQFLFLFVDTLNYADHHPKSASKARRSSSPAASPSSNPWLKSSSTKTPSAAPAAAPAPATAHLTPNQPTAPTWSYQTISSRPAKPTREQRSASTVPRSWTARNIFCKTTRIMSRVRPSPIIVAVVRIRRSQEWMRSPSRSLRVKKR